MSEKEDGYSVRSHVVDVVAFQDEVSDDESELDQDQDQVNGAVDDPEGSDARGVVLVVFEHEMSRGLHQADVREKVVDQTLKPLAHHLEKMVSTN